MDGLSLSLNSDCKAVAYRQATGALGNTQSTPESVQLDTVCGSYCILQYIHNEGRCTVSVNAVVHSTNTQHFSRRFSRCQDVNHLFKAHCCDQILFLA